MFAPGVFIVDFASSLFSSVFLYKCSDNELNVSDITFIQLYTAGLCSAVWGVIVILAFVWFGSAPKVDK